MNRNQREIVNRLVEALLDVAADKRPAALDVLCDGIAGAENTPLLRAEVERLLSEDVALPDQLAVLAAARSATKAATLDAGTAAGVTPPTTRAPTALERVPPIVGRYHIRSPLGVGGMGQVFLAEQRAPIRRTVAIKLIRSGFDSHEVIARFDAERQALARMDHPNIARVLDAGMTDAGRPYFVMEYVAGQPITHFADEERLDLHQRLQLFAQVCDAVAHAHTKGVIHRDLKPSNVLAFKGDEGAFVAKVIDFGIAKALASDGGRLGETSYHTDAGVVVGTYEYMSPEQAATSTDIDTRADVYSLGVLLYELLTGVRPFERSESTRTADEELRRVIRDVDPPRPSTRVQALAKLAPASQTRGVEASTPKSADVEAIALARRIERPQLVRTLQRELEWIPLMALRKDRQRRYAGPAEMAADVRNYLDGRPLLAAQESRVYQTRKFVARHRAALAVATALLLLLVAGAVGTSIGFLREQSARRQADESNRRATWSAYRSAIVAAEVALQNGDAIRLGQSLEAAPVEHRGWEWRSIARSAATPIATLRAPEHYFATYPLPDNRRGLSTTRDAKGTCVLWELSTGAIIRREAGGDIAVDPAGGRFAIVRPDGSLELIATDSGEVQWRVPRRRNPWHLAPGSFSKDGERMVAWDGSADHVTAIAVSSGEPADIPAGASIDRLIGFVDLGERDDATRVSYYSSGAVGTLSVDLEKAVTSRESRFALVMNGQAMQNPTAEGWLPVGGTSGRTSGGTSAKQPMFDVPRATLSEQLGAFVPRRGLLVYGCADGSVAVVSPRPGTAPATQGVESTATRRILVGPAPVVSLSATPDETRLIVTLLDGQVRIVPLEPSPVVAVRMNGVCTIEPSPDATRVLALGWGDVQCFDPLTGMSLWGRNLGPHMNRHADWSADGRRVFVATDADNDAGGCETFLLDGTTGEQLAAWSTSAVTIDPGRAPRAADWARDIAGVSFSGDGRSLWVAHSSGALTRVDTEHWTASADEPSDLAGRANIVSEPWAVAVDGEHHGALRRSPDRTRLAQLTVARTADGRGGCGPLLIRDATTGAVVREVRLENAAATACAWSSDGSSLAVAFSAAIDSGRSTVVELDAATGRERSRIRLASGAAISALAHARDAQRLVAFTFEQRMLIFDVRSGEEILSSFVPDAVESAFFTADGALATSGGGYALKLREAGPAGASMPSNGLDSWPGDLAKPASVVEAQRLAVSAQDRLARAYDTGERVEDAAKQFPPDDPATNVFLALARRRPPSINQLNSAALSRMLTSMTSDAELARGEEMLRLAVAIKPQSATLNSNLGDILFVRREYADCIAPLVESDRILQTRNAPSSPATLLRLAIATRHVGDARATDFYSRATAAAARTPATNDPEVATLLMEARALLGVP